MEEAKYFVNELRGIHGVEVCIMPNDDSFHELIFAPHIPGFCCGGMPANSD